MDVYEIDHDGLLSPLRAIQLWSQATANLQARPAVDQQHRAAHSPRVAGHRAGRHQLGELLDALVPILREVPETDSRIYQRLATVFDAAVIEGLRRENPATRIRRELTKRAGRRERTNFASMAYQDDILFLAAYLVSVSP
jgi:hypothetical protein